MASKGQYGFTMAELLVILAILGIISAFTIPKVLSAQHDGKKKAVFRETIAMMAQIGWEGTMSGQLRGDTIAEYCLEKINAVKACYNDAINKGCWGASQPVLGGPFSPAQSAYVLHNGAQVGGWQNTTANSPFSFIVIDWNGPEGPNVEGEDQIILRVLLQDNVATGMPAYPSQKGSIIPIPGYSNSENLYREIFN